MSDEITKPTESDAAPEQDSEPDEFSRPHVRSRSDEAIAESQRLACICAKIADEYRGTEIVVLNLTDVTPIVDFFVIATGTTRRQMHAIAEEVDRVFAKQGSKRVGLEGYQESSWILQDYGDIVLHVFTEDMRKLYDLERLWADAPRVDWAAAEV